MKRDRLFNLNAFTLIEVIVAMFIVSILLLGVITTLDVVDKMYFNIFLKQRAIYTLNSQTERLTSLYRWCSPNIFEPPADNDGNIIYTSSAFANAAGCSTNNNSFIISNIAGFNSWEAVYYNNISNYNAVFIDKDKQIAAKLWWNKVTVNQCGLCNNEIGCTNLATSDAICLIIHLRYPYRWTANGIIIDTNLDSQPKDITIQTIVARNQ